MKKFEVSSKENEANKHFKIILHEIYDESYFDDANGVANKVNSNGLGWRRKWVEKALPTINGAWLRAEFIDEDRVETDGHGMVGVRENGLPDFSDAVTIGRFTNGYIDEIEEDGEKKTVCVGEGELDALCYPNFVEHIQEQLENNESVYGSVEILKTDGNDAIIYEYGYHNDQRIPMVYRYSAYAVLGLATPADFTAKVVEVNENKRKEDNQMNDVDIQAIVSQAVAEICACLKENESKDEQMQSACDAKVKEANELIDVANMERDEAKADIAKVQAALDSCRSELEAKEKECNDLYEEAKAIKKELAKMKADKRISEMNSAIANFTEAERKYAEAEIEAFKNDPIASEINTITSKIYEGIGKAAKASTVVETNSSVDSGDIDIFCEVFQENLNIDDTNIF